jgi:hypothetical protein
VKIADYGKAITSYIESPTTAQKLKARAKAETLGRTFLAEGSDDVVIPPRKPKQLKDLYERINRTVIGIRSNSFAPELLLPNLEKATQEYIKDGLISGADARKFAIERKEYWDKWIQDNPGGTVPVFDFDNDGNAVEVSDEEIIERLNEADGGTVKRKEFKRGTPITNDIIELVKKYRIEDKMGSGMIADAIQKNDKLNVGRSTVTKILRNLKDQGIPGIDIPTSELASSVAQRLDPDIAPARSGERKIYKLIRPVRELDLKQNPTIPKNAKFKVQLPTGIPTGQGPTTEIKYFKTKEAAETGIKKAEANVLKAKQLKAKPFDDAVKAIHNIALDGADEINDVKNLSKLVYGDSSLKNLKNISNDLVKYQEFLLGFREVPGLKTPNVNQLDEIFSEFPSQNQWGQFAGEELRRSKLKIRDNILKVKGDKLFTVRQKILKAIDTGVFNLDEAMGLSATFENAPGYTELGQIIKKKVNSIKGRQIDGPFSRIFPKVLDGTASVEEVNNFNKISSAFQNKHGVDTPLIEYEPGKKLQAKKFISNFSDLSEVAQTNIQSLADKGVVLKTKSSPMSTILKGVAKKSAKYIPFIGTGIGIADVAKAKELGVDNPIDLFAAYHISPEVALASKKYREDPEYRAKSRAETFSIPLDEGTYDAIDEQTSTFGKYNDQIKNIKLP